MERGRGIKDLQGDLLKKYNASYETDFVKKWRAMKVKKQQKYGYGHGVKSTDWPRHRLRKGLITNTLPKYRSQTQYIDTFHFSLRSYIFLHQ